jgi:putative glycosyltransferase (TIGR04348 family)
VSPPSRSASAGNTVTAQRYAKIFRKLGYTCRIAPEYRGEDVRCLVALHARKSAKSLLAYRAAYPQRRVILVLTGTDVYRDIRKSGPARRAMQAADVLVTLQSEAIRELPRSLRRKARAIIQSAPRRRHTAQRGGVLRVCVLGHLRAEKDPMRAAYAVRRLKHADVHVTHAGGILAPRFADAVQAEMRGNPRYRYLGELPRAQALALLAHSDLLVQSSRMEGGANTVCEAIACGTPVLASNIPGNTGLLGKRYPGLYKTGDTAALARVLERAATDGAFYELLKRSCNELRALVQPQRELRSWKEVLG